jgi:predicted  nucleic acid-binding Zn-ribbon protein
MESNKPSDRTFWQRPEGKTGMLFVAAALAGSGYLLYKFLPILIVLLENTLYASLMGGALFLLTSPIWSSKVRALTSYIGRSLMRSITGLVIEVDPIGILKNYIEDIKKNLADMDKEIGNLRGQIERVSGIIADNEKKRLTSLKRASAAKDLNRLGDVQVETRQAGRLQKSNETLKVLLAKMQAIIAALGKLREVSDITVRDMDNDVAEKKAQYDTIKATTKALSSAIKIMNGDPDKRALYDQAMDFLADDYANKVGELENFMEISKGFIASIELDNLVMDKEGEEALAKFEEFEKKLSGFSLGGNAVAVSDEQTVAQDNLHQLFNRR